MSDNECCVEPEVEMEQVDGQGADAANGFERKYDLPEKRTSRVIDVLCKISATFCHFTVLIAVDNNKIMFFYNGFGRIIYVI